MEPHGDRLRTSFSGQAAAFEDDRFIGRLVTDGEWIFNRLELDGSEQVLDVAAGTGHAARGLAGRVRSVVALDATPAMLEAGKRAAAAEGLRNIAFVEGDGTAMSFAPASFDVVVCRFALHHFPDPDALIREMLRCLRPGGQLLVADLVADEHPALAARQNALEALRDPSHAKCLSAEALRARIGALGAIEVRTDLHQNARLLAPWLEQTSSTEAQAELIRAALLGELEGGQPTGLQPHLRDGKLWFEQRFAAVTGRAPG